MAVEVAAHLLAGVTVSVFRRVHVAYFSVPHCPVLWTKAANHFPLLHYLDVAYHLLPHHFNLRSTYYLIVSGNRRVTLLHRVIVLLEVACSFPGINAVTIL